MLNPAPPAHNPGFTLIELMITVAIMAIVTAIGAPYFGAWIQNIKLRNAAESISTGLQLTRSEAVARNQEVEFVLNESNSGWAISCKTVTATCPANIQTRMSADGSSADITVAAADDKTIVFDSLGRMTSPVPAGGATFTSFNVDINPDILPAEKSRDLRITVDLGGGVRLCDPHVLSPDVRACP
jgi:type IV fimbrial biogenesis protein FimT